MKRAVFFPRRPSFYLCSGSHWGRVAESKISEYPFSPKEKAELASLEEELDWQFFLEPGLREIELAADILDRLQAEAKKPHRTENSQKALSPKHLADFFASLSQCDGAALTKRVNAGLRSLGIERRRRGRPGGRKKAALYAAYAEVVRRAIEKTGVLAKKAELKKIVPANGNMTSDGTC